ncbi:hypothetical protein GWL_07300 [Herbaspirillum sp. GW103]|nr:hypothetical protein GWL_07300 [Herbaspirillum sp. GW103]
MSSSPRQTTVSAPVSARKRREQSTLQEQARIVCLGAAG